MWILTKDGLSDVNVKVVIMAGGYGTRLKPLTDELPKPMLPVGGKPLLERTFNHLRKYGINHAYVLTHYKEEKIKEYFGDGSRFGMKLDYVHEDKPLGTAGGLGLINFKEE